MFLFDETVAQADNVIKNASDIQMDEGRLKSVIDKLNTDDITSEIMVPKQLSLEQKLMFVLIWGVSDFCYWPHPKWGNGKDKTTCPSSVLRDCYIRALSDGTDILNPIIMSDLSLKRYRQLTRFDSPCHLCFSYWRLLFIRQAMKILRQKYRGQVVIFLKTYDFDAQKIIEALSTEFLGLNDRYFWKKNTICFLHRAQKITALWNEIYAEETGRFFLHSHHLNLGADDKTPCALRRLNILKYEPNLDKAIRLGEEIPSGSSWEIQLRSAGIMAIEKIKRALRQKERSADNVEQVLWLLSQTDFKENIPPHKTLTWFY